MAMSTSGAGPNATHVTEILAILKVAILDPILAANGSKEEMVTKLAKHVG